MSPDHVPSEASHDTALSSAADVERGVRALYHALLDAWNRRDADGFAALFALAGRCIGFDGSVMEGRAEIGSSLHPIFADHPTAAYVAIVREVQRLAPEVSLLFAVAGMVPPGQSDINPAVNAEQTLVAVREDGRWSIVSFQNTPAAFHGRPQLAQALTAELRGAPRAAAQGKASR